MSVSVKATYKPDYDPDMQAREDNARKLAQIGEAYVHGRDIDFSGVQKHMRFSWQKAAAPLNELLEDLYGYFDTAAAVSVAGGGTHPFNKEAVHLSVHLGPVAQTIAGDGMGNGLALLEKYLKDPSFQAICARHDVREVFTPSNDLAVPARRVSHYNQPRPL